MDPAQHRLGPTSIISLLKANSTQSTTLIWTKLFPISVKKELIWCYTYTGTGWSVYTMRQWLVEPKASKFSSCLGTSSFGSSKVELVILFHSFSTRKNMHGTAEASPRQWLQMQSGKHRRTRLLPRTRK